MHTCIPIKKQPVCFPSLKRMKRKVRVGSEGLVRFRVIYMSYKSLAEAVEGSWYREAHEAKV